jgi:hypothetical protein
MPAETSVLAEVTLAQVSARAVFDDNLTLSSSLVRELVRGYRRYISLVESSPPLTGPQP